MKQTTLVLGKRSLEVSSESSKKRLRTTGTGSTAAEPIMLLDDQDDAGEPPTTLSKLESATVPPAPLFEAKLDLLPRHEGPTQFTPLRINPPPFALSSSFTHAKGQSILKDPDLDLLFFKTFIRGRHLYEYLLRELPWYRVVYDKNGTTIRTPRWTCVWGCDDTGAIDVVYDIKPRVLPDLLRELKDHVEEQTGAKYNFCLVNFYENGKDSISWHSDDES
jgi:hypothetical protein